MITNTITKRPSPRYVLHPTTICNRLSRSIIVVHKQLINSFILSFNIRHLFVREIHLHKYEFRIQVNVIDQYDEKSDPRIDPCGTPHIINSICHDN